jgi:predicted nucleic acid-binding Zn ribbon protein
MADRAPGSRRPLGPRSLAAAIRTVRSELAPPTLLAQVQERWREAVGEQVASEAEPVHERAGTVTISCRSATWAAELAMLSGRLLERLNELLPDGSTVTELKFTTRPT